jgi:pimeloyl-ACP methyl ester carboxylesterase
MRFVLVHGGAHGAWCWELLIPELKSRGHDALAMDLPGHGARCAEISTLDGYREAVVDVLKPGDVLVGHSVGAPVATMAADAFLDVRHVVYLAGPLPVEGRPMAYDSGGTQGEDGSLELMADVEGGADQYHIVSPDLQTFSFDLEGARASFYHDCPSATAQWAFEHMTPQRIDVMVSEPIVLKNFWEADLPRSFIRCTEDRVLPAAISAKTVNRLGVEELTINSSHSPFLSRPPELAELILTAVETKPIGPLIPMAL